MLMMAKGRKAERISAGSAWPAGRLRSRRRHTLQNPVQSNCCTEQIQATAPQKYAVESKYEITNCCMNSENPDGSAVRVSLFE